MPFDVLRVVGGVGLQLVGRDHRDQLILLDGVAFLDQQLRDLPGDLRADDDVVGGDDAGEGQRGGRALGVAIERQGAGDEDDEDDETAGTGHTGITNAEGVNETNNCIKQMFEWSSRGLGTGRIGTGDLGFVGRRLRLRVPDPDP